MAILPPDDELEIESFPQCIRCQRLDRAGRGEMTCAAFPDGIPTAILLNEHDHFQDGFPGDNGIRGEPMEPADDDAEDFFSP